MQKISKNPINQFFSFHGSPNFLVDELFQSKNITLTNHELKRMQPFEGSKNLDQGPMVTLCYNHHKLKKATTTSNDKGKKMFNLLLKS